MLGGQLRNVRFVSGATILNDGEPSLILNVFDIFAAAEGENCAPWSPGVEEASRPARILVVDDSITTRTLERSILTTHGYGVEVAEDGEEALAKAREERFDLVISDVEMPGMNGLELIDRLHELEAYRDVPVIVVSSLTDPEVRQRAATAGARGYLTKGAFDPDQLLAMVQVLTRRFPSPRGAGG